MIASRFAMNHEGFFVYGSICIQDVLPFYAKMNLKISREFTSKV
jgi:hypothetical protein